MKCPQCKAPMLVVEFDEIELDHCALCEGTWFDRDELHLLLQCWGADTHSLRPEHVASLPDASSSEALRRCPICWRTMRKVVLGTDPPVLIDACPTADGLWFADREVISLAQQLLGEMPTVPDQAVKFMGRVFHGPNLAKQEGDAE